MGLATKDARQITHRGTRRLSGRRLGAAGRYAGQLLCSGCRSGILVGGGDVRLRPQRYFLGVILKADTDHHGSSHEQQNQCHEEPEIHQPHGLCISCGGGVVNRGASAASVLAAVASEP